ncbi:MAG: hypothetical protein MUP81_06150 [Dehalococcoidia bacterium]|nr:hypothetical protein [Dehalococcoidia bacterium]
MAIEVKDETLTAENVQVNLKTLHVALGSYSFSPKDIARMAIVKAVRDGLTPEDKVKLEEYENRENPCGEER